MKVTANQRTQTTQRVNLMALVGTQFWRFRKSPINFLLLAGFLLAGLYGLYQGFAFKRKQVTTITTFRAERNTNLQRMVGSFRADTATTEGREAYYEAAELLGANWNLVLPAFKYPVSTAIFAIGQSDVFPYYYTVKNEGFFMQLFKQGEIANPLRSLAGHFDTCFWVIYLFPLLIVMLLFNALAAELDNGNWRLIHSQGMTARQWLLSQFVLVALLVEGLFLVVFVSGLLLNYLFFGQLPAISDLLFFVGANLYTAFWLSVVYCINAFGRSTGTNAFYAGTAWIVACIVLPALVTMLIESSIRVDNTTVSRMSRRPQGAKFEDDAFGVRTIRQMVKLRPQFRDATVSPGDQAFYFAVYMAYHEMLDDTNRVAVQSYFDGIEQRQRWTNASVVVNPSAAVDGIFAGLAANDAMANHRFVWQTMDLHARLHEVFFSALFTNRLLRESDYRSLPVFEPKRPNPFSWELALNYAGLLGMSVFLFGYANRRLKRWVG